MRFVLDVCCLLRINTTMVNPAVRSRMPTTVKPGHPDIALLQSLLILDVCKTIDRVHCWVVCTSVWLETKLTVHSVGMVALSSYDSNAATFLRCCCLN